MRRTLLALVLLFAAWPLAAYVIIFKDGTKLEAKEKYKVQGKLAIITLPNGATTTYPLDKIDIAKTDSGNFGSATVVQGGGGSLDEMAGKLIAEAVNTPSNQANLSKLAAQRRSTLPPAPSARNTPAPAAPASAAAPAKTGPVKTPGGYLDLQREPRVALADSSLGSVLGDLLRAHGVDRASVYQGTQPNRLLLEVTATSEGTVFQAIAAAAQAVLEIESKRPGAVEALELFVTTDRHQRAGQFLITRDRAQELVTKRLDLTSFYVKYVEF
jgi:hypothetical protein